MTWAATQPTWSDPSGKSPLTYLVQPVWRIVFDCICVSLEEDWFSSLKKPSALPSAYIRWRDIQIERTTEYTKSVGKRQEMMNPVKEQVISGIDPFSHEDRIFNLTTATWPTIRRKKIDMLPSRSCLYHSFSWGRDMTTISGCVNMCERNWRKRAQRHSTSYPSIRLCKLHPLMTWAATQTNSVAARCRRKPVACWFDLE